MYLCTVKLSIGFKNPANHHFIYNIIREGVV
nr:MAG TPA: cell division protein kinase [Caudoviricetes sp.]